MPYRRRRRRRLFLRRRTLARLAAIAGAAVLIGLVVRSVDWGPSKAQHMARADKYVSEHKDAEAVIEYRRAVQQDTNDAEARSRLALAYARLGDARNAMRETI